MVSLGCPKNLVDSEVMLGMAEQDGHEITADASEADVLVVNTCAFIDRAKQESIDTILEMAQLKGREAGRRLIGTGPIRRAAEDRRGTTARHNAPARPAHSTCRMTALHLGGSRVFASRSVPLRLRETRRQVQAHT